MTRLWTIVELWTCTAVKPPGAVRMVRVGDAELPEAFDVRECGCFDPSERERILTLIERGALSFERFNAAIYGLVRRTAMETASFKQDKGSSRASSPEPGSPAGSPRPPRVRTPGTPSAFARRAADTKATEVAAEL
mmetsp:Transcript_757/g.2332  ORF Transcript_757/g.2332 Transcript_757/m.2332 type:complete len:136 (+) Transcript_757:263-670(+)